MKITEKEMKRRIIGRAMAWKIATEDLHKVAAGSGFSGSATTPAGDLDADDYDERPPV
jgi:hypothetical protein